jgi:hypothetical protein
LTILMNLAIVPSKLFQLITKSQMSSVASRRLPTEGPSAGGNEFDDLDDYDAGLDDPFSDNYVVPGAKEREAAAKATEKESTSKGKSGAGLGIDEEIDTKKPRAPRVKLDEHRYGPLYLRWILLIQIQTSLCCRNSKITEEGCRSFEI